jgi:hypothetical protein
MTRRPLALLSVFSSVSPCLRGVVAASLVGATLPAGAQDFWSHWGDGQAELSGYRLTQPRYGAARAGTAVLIFVTEEFSDSARVKADPGQHPPSDVYPVLKLNALRAFQTGIYDYNVMTSTFARVAAGWPIAKVSFSSQEWCGHVYHQLLPRAAGVAGTWHSYFDGEADGAETLPQPEDGLYEDALPIVLRGLRGDTYLRPGESRTVPLLPSLLSARLEHKKLAWSPARVSRAERTESVRVPAGTFEVVTWTVTPEGRPTLTFQVEAAPPHRLVRWASDKGEGGALLKSTRLPYWKLNSPGGEKHLRDLGLRP